MVNLPSGIEMPSLATEILVDLLSQPTRIKPQGETNKISHKISHSIKMQNIKW